MRTLAFNGHFLLSLVPSLYKHSRPFSSLFPLKSHIKIQKEMLIIERIITIEYLDPSMSQHLLSKFPDASSLGFNYSESGIWSPLLPRGRGGFESFGSSDKLRRPKWKKKTTTTSKKKKKKKKKTMGDLVTKRLDFSPTPKKGWNRLLKAAARRFKLQKRAAIQMILPTL